MIIYKNKSGFQYNSELTNINILAYNKINMLTAEELSDDERDKIANDIKLLDDMVYVIDDMSQHELSIKIRNNFPYIDFILENDKLIDVTILEKPSEPKTDIELLQERLLQLEVAEVNRKSKEIEQQILGGTV